MSGFTLENYLSNGVEKILKGIIRASLENPNESLFMVKHIVDSKKARKLRKEAETAGEHIPPFLIASITNQCNLHCKGCYARANNSCNDHGATADMMTSEDWGNVFSQAEKIGVEFILLAGGEPFVRKDVLAEAGKHNKILFPIFTNGTMIDEEYIELLAENQNLIPVVSIEGNRKTTELRRGDGIYDKFCDVMKLLKDNGILFGASVTVTKKNLDEVLAESFTKDMENKGVKAIIYVEYVPADNKSMDLALDDSDREKMGKKLEQLRQTDFDMILISFPGDEKAAGGCLAAGRGFLHINAFGGAEPCPFSPYSDTSLKKVSLKEALRSPLFLKLQNNGNLTEEHVGGCVLFEQRAQVEKYLSE